MSTDHTKLLFLNLIWLRCREKRLQNQIKQQGYVENDIAIVFTSVLFNSKETRTDLVQPTTILDIL